MDPSMEAAHDWIQGDVHRRDDSWNCSLPLFLYNMYMYYNMQLTLEPQGNFLTA